MLYLYIVAQIRHANMARSMSAPCHVCFSCTMLANPNMVTSFVSATKSEQDGGWLVLLYQLTGSLVYVVYQTDKLSKGHPINGSEILQCDSTSRFHVTKWGTFLTICLISCHSQPESCNIFLLKAKLDVVLQPSCLRIWFWPIKCLRCDANNGFLDAPSCQWTLHKEGNESISLHTNVHIHVSESIQ